MYLPVRELSWVAVATVCPNSHLLIEVVEEAISTVLLEIESKGGYIPSMNQI